MTKMHLLWFCAFSPHAGFGLDGWAGSQTGTGYDWTTPELWQDMAVALERAKFDLILLGDSLAVPGTYQGRMDASLRYAEHAPFHDPSPLVAILAAATRRLGLALTLSTTFYPPFLLARLLTTLDHLGRGRIMQGRRELIDLLTRQTVGKAPLPLRRGSGCRGLLVILPRR